MLNKICTPFSRFLYVNNFEPYIPALFVDNDLERLQDERAEEGVDEEELPDAPGEGVGEDGPVEVLVRLGELQEDGVGLGADRNL